jgi:SAM-dependent methyltransferase
LKRMLDQLTSRLPLVAALAARRLALRLRVRALLCRMRTPASRRRAVAQSVRLEPAFTARDRPGFQEAAERASLTDLPQPWSQTLRNSEHGAFQLQRFCLCCNRSMPMLVDYESSMAGAGGERIPNWRERLVCSGCGMNNRQRLVARLMQQVPMPSAHPAVYLMEQVTPIFEWARVLVDAEVHGSEYLGHQYRGGQRVYGVRHEDVMNLSYPDRSFDLIVSNDVLEHIPDPEGAFRECSRVLKPGGSMLATFPFHVQREASVTRARLAAGGVEHLLAPQYHGNPVSAEGSLVFHDFGWDLLDVIRGAGFSSASCEVYSSDEFGHFGAGLLVFRMVKPTGAPRA